jgi:hypothetical protein
MSVKKLYTMRLVVYDRFCKLVLPYGLSSISHPLRMVYAGPWIITRLGLIPKCRALPKTLPKKRKVGRPIKVPGTYGYQNHNNMIPLRKSLEKELPYSE